MKKPVYTAVIMAAGGGLRMQSAVKKQFMELCGAPVVAHTIKAFQDNDNIDYIVLVIPKGEADEALKLCIRYGFDKVKNITEGSDERFKSVYNGLLSVPEDTDYVLIHDGVRPMVDDELIDRCCKYVKLTRACVAAVPVTDTIKRADSNGFAEATLDRASLWSIQTPQSFSYSLILKAYNALYKTIEEYGSDTRKITDDAVIVENMTDTRVRIIRGDYKNIKITTPNDMIIARAYMEERKKEEERLMQEAKEEEKKRQNEADSSADANEEGSEQPQTR